MSLLSAQGLAKMTLEGLLQPNAVYESEFVNLGEHGQGETISHFLSAVRSHCPSGLLSLVTSVTAEHLHRVTSLFPVVGDRTTDIWCAQLMLW